MFILLLTYKRPLSEVDNYLPAHVIYLDKYYSQGKFIASGRQIPRVGGVIFCKAENKSEVENIIQDDPFFSNGIADYNIVEFMPSRFAEGMDILLEK